jgi:hypothetical protein
MGKEFLRTGTKTSPISLLVLPRENRHMRVGEMTTAIEYCRVMQDVLDIMAKGKSFCVVSFALADEEAQTPAKKKKCFFSCWNGVLSKVATFFTSS